MDGLQLRTLRTRRRGPRPITTNTSVPSENLRPLEINAPDAPSIPYPRRIQQLSEEFASRDDFVQGDSSTNKSVGELLVLILRLIRDNNVAILKVENGARWNTRRLLGSGTSFNVQETRIPMESALGHSQYWRIDGNDQVAKGVFADHTGKSWGLETQVACKFASGNEEEDGEEFILRRLDDFIRDFRVLCHPPLRDHPNIIQLLGVVWTDDADGDDETNDNLPEWPTVLTQLAPHRSLSTFLVSRAYQGARVSLKAKLGLCIDVLLGLAALHSCRIVHGDIKCENVLVFDTSEVGSKENWKARLTDFGSSTWNHEKDSADGRSRQAIYGTTLYQPPELDRGDRCLPADEVNAVDIWCWGMLLWRIMIDGKQYQKVSGELITEGVMQDLRTRGDVATAAVLSVGKYLRNQHTDLDSRVLDLICSLLQQALGGPPINRPTAAGLLEGLKSGMPDMHAGLKFSSTTTSTSVKPLNILPKFSLNDQWIDLNQFSSLGSRIFQELLRESRLSTSHPVDLLNAKTQLALCKCIGFGTAEDRQEGMALMVHAATEGSIQAQAIIAKLESSLGISSSVSESTKMTWLRAGMKSRSRIAIQDFRRCYHQQFEDTRHELQQEFRRSLSAVLSGWHAKNFEDNSIAASMKQDPKELINTDSNLDLILAGPQLAFLQQNIEQYQQYVSILSKPDNDGDTPLLKACKVADYEMARYLIGCNAGINELGPAGDSPLHHTVNFSPHEACDIATRLVEAGAHTWKTTFKDFSFSEIDHICNVIPSRTTPLLWAIESDNIVLVRHLIALGSDPLANGTRTNNPVAWAAQYQSINCLKYFCEDPRWAFKINAFDHFGNSALWYAIRPQNVERLLRFQELSEDEMNGTEDSVVSLLGSAPPQAAVMFRQREVDVISILMGKGVEIRATSTETYNCLHQAAAISKPEIIRVLIRGLRLRDPKFVSTILKRPNKAGFTPLGVSIRYAREDNFVALIDAGADVNFGSNLNQQHSLHVVARTRSPCALRMANILINRDKTCVNARNRHNVTPLHFAAGSGQNELMQLLISHGAKVTTSARDGTTPLAAAIVNKSIRAVRFLCRYYAEHNIPLLAVRDLWPPYNPLFIILPNKMSVFEFIVTPGWYSPEISRLGFQQPLGCLDYPFSETSRVILNILLQTRNAKDPIANPYSLPKQFSTTEDASGLVWATMLGDRQLVELIVSSGKFPGINFRKLIKTAFRQFLCQEKQHVAALEDRREVLTYLILADKDQWDQLRSERRRKSFGIGFVWRIYYASYGDMERRQHMRWDNWRKENPKWLGPSCVELEPDEVVPMRASYVVPSLCILWVLLIPFITYLCILRADPNGGQSSRSTIFLIVFPFLATIEAFWPKIFRILFILYDNFQENLPVKSWLHRSLQACFVLFFFLCNVGLMYILLTQVFTPVDADSIPLLLPKAQTAYAEAAKFQTALTVYFFTAQGLIQAAVCLLYFASLITLRQKRAPDIFLPTQFAHITAKQKTIVL